MPAGIIQRRFLGWFNGVIRLGMARLYLKRINVLDHNIEERKWLVARGNVLVFGFRCFPAEMVAKFESEIVDHKACAGRDAQIRFFLARNGTITCVGGNCNLWRRNDAHTRRKRNIRPEYFVQKK